MGAAGGMHWRDCSAASRMACTRDTAAILALWVSAASVPAVAAGVFVC